MGIDGDSRCGFGTHTWIHSPPWPARQRDKWTNDTHEGGLQGCATPSYLTPAQIRRMGSLRQRMRWREWGRGGRAWRVLALLGVCVRLSGQVPDVWLSHLSGENWEESRQRSDQKASEILLQRRWGLHLSGSNGYREVIKRLTGEDTIINQEKSQSWWLGCWLDILRWPMSPDKSPETRKDSILVSEIQNCLFPGLKSHEDPVFLFVFMAT